MYTWPSPAKINLFLYVTGIRKDGYHNIQTLFQFLDYGDELKIIPNKTGKIEFFIKKEHHIDIKNSIVASAQLLKKKALLYGKLNISDYGVKIFLKKKIPIGSGLGGGSSNAATTLVVLNKLWNVDFTLQELAFFGLEIGTDVPGFIMGNTAIIEGIGDLLYPIIREEKWYLVVYPDINISTSNMFSNPFLKSNTPKKSVKALLNSPFSNDFEYIAKQQFIKIKQLILILSSYAPSRMTGTGSCVFSEFNNKKSAQEIFSLLPKNIHGFVAKSVNISPLHKTLNKK